MNDTISKYFYFLFYFIFPSYSERCGWIPGGMEVPQNLAREYRWINGLSVTEMEIMHGAYRIDNPNCK